MAGNFECIKTRRFGVEIEMTGITRCAAAKAIQKVLGGSINHEGGTYDKYTVGDEKGRRWQIVYDSSIFARKKNGCSASDLYKVEMNSPILEFEDLDLLQQVIRALREAGAITEPDYDCGTHIHIDASFQHYLSRYVSPSIFFHFDEDVIDGNRVVVLTIPAARIVPTEYKDIRYIRIGSSKENIKKHPDREAALFRVLNYGPPSMLNTPSRFSKLSFDQLFLYYETKGIKLREDTFKENLELLTSDGKYNMLAQLLSDDPHIDIQFALSKRTYLLNQEKQNGAKRLFFIY